MAFRQRSNAERRLQSANQALAQRAGELEVRSVPVGAKGETLGILHLAANDRAQRDASPAAAVDEFGTAAVAAADQVALALANLRLQESLRLHAIRDPLTGLFNRRYFEVSFERELRRAIRKNGPLSVIELDLDHFKRFNDTFGHAAGDVLLREFGYSLQRAIRIEDVACRHGGEEFVLILPETTLAAATDRAHELLGVVRTLDVRHAGQPLGKVTASAGIAAFPDHGATVEELMRVADRALYRAKANGRDRFELAEVPVRESD